MNNNYPLIRKIYLYLFTLIGLVLVVIGLVRLVNLGLKAFIFTSADTYYAYPMPAPVAPDKNTSPVQQPSAADLQAYQDSQTKSQRERDAAESLAMMVVGLPLYLYHWGVIKKEKTNA